MPTVSPTQCRTCHKGVLLRILLVEDNPVEALTLKRIIEEQSPNACVEIVDTLAKMTALAREDFDIALVDLNLPDADPREMIQALKNFDLPVAVITGHGYPELAEEVGETLGLPVMIKPSSRLDIESIARNVIGLASFRQHQERELQELRALKIFKAVDGKG